jgi:hypothetical protein
MPIFEVESPTGKILEIEGDTMPTESELKTIFSKFETDKAQNSTNSRDSQINTSVNNYNNNESGLSEEQLKIVESEKPNDPLLAGIESFISNLGINIGHKHVENQLKIRNKLKAEGKTDEQIKRAQTVSSLTSTPFEVAKITAAASIPGLVKGGIGLGAISGSEKLLNELAEGESLMDSAQEAIKTGGSVAATDIAVGGSIRAPFKVGSKLLKKPSEVGKKINRANTIINRLKEDIGNIKTKTAKTIIDFDKKIQDLKAKKLINEKSFTAPNSKINDSVLVEKISELDKSIDESTQGLIKPLSEGIGKVKSSLSSEYNRILKGEAGRHPVDVSDEITLIANALNIKSTAPKNKLIKEVAPKLSKLIESNNIKSGLMNIDSKNAILSNDGVLNLELKDAHWIKQALKDYSETLMNKSSNIELGLELKNIARNIDDKIDLVSNKEYKALNKRYREFAQVDEFLNKKIGPVVQLFNNRERTGIEKVSKEIKKAIKSGRKIDDELIKSQSDQIRAVNAKVRLLRENGFNNEAELIEDNVRNISKANIKKFELQKVFSEAKKNLKDQDKQIIDSYRGTINKLNEQIKDLNLKKARAKTKSSEKIEKLDKFTRKIPNIFEDAGIKQHLDYTASTALGDSIASASGSSTVRNVIDIAKLIKMSKVYGFEAAVPVQKLFQSIDSKIANSNLKDPIRFSLMKYVEDINSDQGESSDE